MAADWANYMGPKFDGIYQEDGLKLNFTNNKPSSAWKVQLKTGFSSVTVSNGRVYSMGHAAGQDTVYCLSEKDGSIVWSKSYKAELQPNLYEGGPNSTPTVHDSLLYSLGKHGQLFCWDASNGTEKWSVNLTEKYGYEAPDWGFSGSPYIHGDLVILNAGSAGIAFERKTGNLAWKSAPGKASYASVAPYSTGGKDQVLLFGAKSIMCLDGLTGKEVWSLEWTTSYDVNSATPVLYGKDIFISSGYGKGASFTKVNNN